MRPHRVGRGRHPRDRGGQRAREGRRAGLDEADELLDGVGASGLTPLA
jgi:hypothetical protein